jgi:hypothetical protein
MHVCLRNLVMERRVTAKSNSVQGTTQGTKINNHQGV